MSTELDTLRSENIRLRAILKGISRAGLGQGALIELCEGQRDNTIMLVVCRADVSESEFTNEIRSALESLAGVFGGVLGTERIVGVEAEQPKDITETPQ